MMCIVPNKVESRSDLRRIGIRGACILLIGALLAGCSIKMRAANDPDISALERELIAYCREHLADVKCPRSVDFREELPRHATGKLYKRLLKDEYWKGHETRLL